jgi:hypothetical protein
MEKPGKPIEDTGINGPKSNYGTWSFTVVTLAGSWALRRGFGVYAESEHDQRSCRPMVGARLELV